LTILSIRGKAIDPAISLIIFLFAALIVGAIPFAYHDTAAQNFPDEETLLSFFGADSCQIASTSVEERNSYACSAFLLESVGLSAKTAPIAGALLSVSLTLIPIFQFSRISLGVFLVSLGWGFIRAIFLSVLSKDMLSACVVLLSIMAAQHSGFGLTWFLSSTVYGWVVRKYWLLVSATWLGLRLIRNQLTVFRLFVVIVLVYIALSLTFQIALGATLDFARAAVNENRDVGAEGSRTVIDAVIASDNAMLQALNATITFFRLAFPLELLRFGSVSQLAFISIMPFTFIWMVQAIVKGVKSDSKYLIQAGKVALAPLSFLIIEGVFEPDFGSFARHFAIVSPLVFSALALVQKSELAQEKLLRRRKAATATTTPTTTPSTTPAAAAFARPLAQDRSS
jgi:hypothetical protein